ncbi:30S ribosome-binding factor RbfA [Phycisphaerales bacterium]|nr:30S ribosome-binding factor RbfA [Phycisphaerales bacterium]
MARRRFQETDRQDRVRPRQVASLLSRVIQERISRGFADPRIRGLVSVTKIDLAENLQIATISISVLPDKYGVRVLAGLKSASGLFRKTIRDETALRRVPDLRFKLDDSIKNDAALDAAIRDGFDSLESDSSDTDVSVPDDSARRDGPVDVDSPRNDFDDDSARPPEDHEVPS